MVPTVWFFEKVCLSFSSGLTRTEVFEYDDVIRHDSACPVKDAIVFSSYNSSTTFSGFFLFAASQHWFCQLADPIREWSLTLMFSFQNVEAYEDTHLPSWGSRWIFELKFLLEKSQRFIEVYKSSSFEGLFQDTGGKRGLSSLEETEEDITIFPACLAPIVTGWLFLVCVIKTGIFLWKKL